jgi:hypothetical protein
MGRAKDQISFRDKKVSLFLLIIFLDKEYVRYAEEISWVTTLKDVYRRYCQANDQFFYIRHSSFLCCFRRENGAERIAELIPSALLTRQIKDSKFC